MIKFNNAKNASKGKSKMKTRKLNCMSSLLLGYNHPHQYLTNIAIKKIYFRQHQLSFNQKMTQT